MGYRLARGIARQGMTSVVLRAGVVGVRVRLFAEKFGRCSDPIRFAETVALLCCRNLCRASRKWFESATEKFRVSIRGE